MIKFHNSFSTTYHDSKEVLWTVYSERKLHSCLTLKFFQNPFNKDKSVGLYKIPRTKKDLKFAPAACRVRKAKLYIYHSSKIAKVGPRFDEIP